jgi:hypothetical protein
MEIIREMLLSAKKKKRIHEYTANDLACPGPPIDIHLI